MSTSKSVKKQINRGLRKRLIHAIQEADASRNYDKTIKIYERYRREYAFDARLEYNLALLYDHSNFQKKSKRNLSRALEIYRRLIKENPKDPLFLHGLSRVYQELGRKRLAIQAEVRAYHLLRKLPRNKRGIIGVGNVFLLQKDFKNAEKWFKRELKDMGLNNFAANANLLMFYDSIGDKRRAGNFARKTKILLEKEIKLLPKNIRYKNATVQSLLEKIRKNK